jgi:hypothetical protein
LSSNSFGFGNQPVVDEKSTLPYSKQATIIDTTSTSEVLLEATGIYYSPYKKNKSRKKDILNYGVQEAEIDAKKAAIYSLLYLGTDPILFRQDEQNRFRSIEESFFLIENLESFISYEDEVPKRKINLNNNEGIKIVKQIKVNRDALIQNLVQNGVLKSKAALTSIMGNPYIMVMPNLNQGQTIQNAFESNPFNKLAAGVIQGALTQRQYDVVIPDQQANVSSMLENYRELSSVKADQAYSLALKIGSDIYIDFSISESGSEYETKKYAVTLRAFETTTSRLLGSETGHSNSRRGDDMVSIEEAILQALNNLLSRVTNYWKTDIEKGVQYRVIVRISPDKSNFEEIQNILIDSLEAMTQSTKEIAITSYTSDFVVWVNPETINSTRKLFRKFKSNYSKMDGIGKLEIVNQNRKVLQLVVN